MASYPVASNKSLQCSIIIILNV